MRNFKALGLALVAALAMTAMASASASAQEFEAHGVETARVIANQEAGNEHVFTVDGSDVECETAEFATRGEEGTPTTSITVHPVYEDCTAFGFEATVDTSTCDYTITATGIIDVINAPGSECSILIDAVSCQVTVGAQTGLESVSFTNLPTEPSTVRIAANVSGIAVNKLQDGFLCPLEGTGPGTGTYEGNTIAEGFSGPEQVGITHIP